MQPRIPDQMDQWIERTTGPLRPRFRLFCFPYAGGGAGIFRGWAKEIGASVEVCAIRLPGREKRYAEPAFRRSEEVVESLVPILPDFLGMPFAMFGHSMGAILAYEVARGILKTMGVEPRALFVSARRGPDLRSTKPDVHHLPREELLARVRALNGTPAEVFQNDDLVELILPTLRCDFEMAECYRHAAGPTLSCPVIAMGGRRDADISAQDIAGWRSVTSGPFKSMMFDGDHFFLSGNRTPLLQALRQELASLGLE
jgi:medium-chain acyl-[acyl-carrier-protein] hydrolase